MNLVCHHFTARLGLVLVVLFLSFFVTACHRKGKLNESEEQTLQIVMSKGGTMEVGYGTNGGISYRIDLSSSSIEDDDLALFQSGCHRVISINLSDTNINGKGMPALTSFVRIGQSIELDLSGTNITDREFARITRNQDISSLSIERTPVTDKLIDLLSSIGHLNLSYTKVTKLGISKLKGKGIRKLELRGLPLADQDVPMLLSLGIEGYNLMDLTGTNISTKGFDELRQGFVGYGVIILEGKPAKQKKKSWEK